jgi:hypothetical protein
LLVFTVTTGCLLGAWYQAAGSLELERMDRFGKTIAAQTAALSIEPLMLNDRVGLAVLASRLTALPEIRGIGIFSIDNQEITRTGLINNRSTEYQYRHPIEMQDNVAGYVQVELERGAFSITFTSILWAPMSISLLVTLLGAIIGSGLITISHESLQSNDEDDLSQFLASNQGADSATCVVSLNLFKRTMASHYPQDEYQTLLGWIKRAANINSARIQELDDGSLLLIFTAQNASTEEHIHTDAHADEETDSLCYLAVRTALLTKQLLLTQAVESGWHDNETEAENIIDLRYGLHWIPGSLDKQNQDYVILLSAVAASGNLAASNEFIQQLGDTRYLLSNSRKNPVLASLSPTESAEFQEISDLITEEREELDGQTDAIIAQAWSKA